MTLIECSWCGQVSDKDDVEWRAADELARLRAELADLLEVHKPLLSDCLALRAENERLRAALAEQVAECDMPGCTLCHEHRQLLRQVAG